MNRYFYDDFYLFFIEDKRFFDNASQNLKYLVLTFGAGD